MTAKELPKKILLPYINESGDIFLFTTEGARIRVVNQRFLPPHRLLLNQPFRFKWEMVRSHRESSIIKAVEVVYKNNLSMYFFLIFFNDFSKRMNIDLEPLYYGVPIKMEDERMFISTVEYENGTYNPLELCRILEKEL